MKLPLNLKYAESRNCGISKQNDRSQVLKDWQLIIWNESTIMHKGDFEALDHTLQNLRNNTFFMNGVTVLLSEDFIQTLPVLQRSTQAD